TTVPTIIYGHSTSSPMAITSSRASTAVFACKAILRVRLRRRRAMIPRNCQIRGHGDRPFLQFRGIIARLLRNRTRRIALQAKTAVDALDDVIAIGELVE